MSLASFQSLLSGPYSKLASLGMFLASSYKDNPFLNSYNEAT